MTGRDTLTARFMRAEFFRFQPEFKLFLATNNKPRAPEHDKALWSRLRLVPFERTFNEDEQDDELPDKLKAELPGILNWALEGCRLWQETGLGHPDEIREATAQWKSEQNNVRDFVEECCVLREDIWTPVLELRKAYERWCDENGQRGSRRWGEALEEMGLVKKAVRRGASVAKAWHGIGVSDDL